MLFMFSLITYPQHLKQRIVHSQTTIAIMSGVFFIVCIPTTNFEHTLLFGNSILQNEENSVKLDVELRNKNSVRHIVSKMEQHYNNYGTQGIKQNMKYDEKYHIPMEKILDELLNKLEIEHVVWCGDKNGNYFEVLFPLPAGDPCENCLHCLTELGIGTELNSVVSVLPCSVVYNSTKDKKSIEEDDLSSEEKSSWNNFLDSVKSKLTVKQVVDGVKCGGNLTFDYIMLILTADCLAALGLVENNAPNIVAAMLVSPLMGPVMSLTFGTTISDRGLQKTGFKSLFIGIIISIIFGFIFGLLLGTTEMPWGFGDWPTEEMKARGNSRCLWIGILWALPSGIGVALALLQGSAGPLIGVAISASLLPPVVNCGLFWALSCIWLAREDIKMPHLKGESYNNYNSSYVPLYSEYMPIEFFVNGIISSLLTFINVIFIFISAIIMLKIKEVAAPYTSSPDVRRFWEKDIKVARENNKSFRRSNQNTHISDGQEMISPNEQIDNILEVALREAVNDDTFKKVKRISYSQQAADEVSQLSASSSTPQLHIPTSALNDLNSIERQISTLIATLPTGSTPPSSRLHTLSRSFRHGSARYRRSTNQGLPTIPERTTTKNNVTKTISLDNTASRTDKLLERISISARELRKEGDDEEKNLICRDT